MSRVKELIKREFYNDEQLCYMYFVGDYTAVCIPVRMHSRVDKVEVGGKTYTRMVPLLMPTARMGYIDFADVRGEGKDAYINEDSPVAGGLDVVSATKIIDELQAAIELMEYHDELMVMTEREM